MAGGAVPVRGTADVSRIEAPITFKTYLICAFAATGGLLFGYDTGNMSGILAMPYFISLYTGIPYDYATGQPIGVDAADFALSSSTKSLMTSILSFSPCQLELLPAKRRLRETLSEQLSKRDPGKHRNMSKTGHT